MITATRFTGYWTEAYLPGVAQSAKRRTTDLTAEESGFDTMQEKEISSPQRRDRSWTCVSYQSPSPRTEVETALSYTSTALYVFTALCFILPSSELTAPIAFMYWTPTILHLI